MPAQDKHMTTLERVRVIGVFIRSEEEDGLTQLQSADVARELHRSGDGSADCYNCLRGLEADGLAARPRWGTWEINEAGKSYYRQNVGQFTPEELRASSLQNPSRL